MNWNHTMTSNGDVSSKTTPSTPGARARRRRWLRAGLVLLVVSPVLAALSWYIGVRVSNTTAVARLEKEVRQLGQPLTPAELPFLYSPIPDEHNAAVALLELWEREDPGFWKAFRAGTRPLPEQVSRQTDPALSILGTGANRLARGAALEPKALALAKQYLSNKAAHMADVQAALRRSQTRFPLAFTDSYNMLLPHLTTLRREAQNFRLAALVAAARGDVPATIAALHDAAGVGQVLSDEPMLISQLVRVACLAITLDGIEDLMSRHELAVPQLEQVNSMLDSMKTSGGLKRALLGERAMCLGAFNSDSRTFSGSASNPNGSLDHESPERGLQVALTGMKITGLAAADKRLMLETFKPMIAVADEETPEALAEIERAVQASSAESRRFPPKILSGMLLPSLDRAAATFARFEARRRGALVAVAVELYRLEHAGQPPKNLEELVPRFLPEIPDDPFDGQPLRYRRLGKGFVVYSIGADRTDNEGKERKPGRGGNRNLDDTFTVER
jgi:hypothetical protein